VYAVGEILHGPNWHPTGKCNDQRLFDHESEAVIAVIAKACAGGKIAAAYRSNTGGADALAPTVWRMPHWQYYFADGTIDLDLPLDGHNPKGFKASCLSEPASLPGIIGSAKFSLEGSVAEIDQWERNGRWKVHRRCRAYLEERRIYHRRQGEIVRLHDDVLCAARYAFMNRRYFKPLDVCYGMPNPVIGPGGRRQLDPGVRFARGTPNHPDGSFDVFTGRMP